MQHIIHYLEQLDLSEAEAKLYLKLLETGPISVRELAQTTGVKRTTAYIYIDQLVEKGLIIKMVKGTQKKVSANRPEECLQDLVEKKVKTAKSVQTEFPDMLKKISTSLPQAKDVNEAEIKYYKGAIGIKKIYEDILQSKEVRSYVNIEEVLQAFPENSDLFDSAFKQNPEMKMFEIVEDSPEAKKRFETSPKKDQYFYKLLPKNMKLTAQDILLYDDKVAIIHFKDKPYGVVLRNTDLYNNFKLLFDFIWKILP